MLTNSDLKSKVDSLWNRFWSSGITKRHTAILQVCHFLLVKLLEDMDNADQILYLRSMQSKSLQEFKLEEADLYEAPFTNFGSNAVEKYFTPEEIEELMELTIKLAA